MDFVITIIIIRNIIIRVMVVPYSVKLLYLYPTIALKTMCYWQSIEPVYNCFSVSILKRPPDQLHVCVVVPAQNGATC